MQKLASTTYKAIPLSKLLRFGVIRFILFSSRFQASVSAGLKYSLSSKELVGCQDGHCRVEPVRGCLMSKYARTYVLPSVFPPITYVLLSSEIAPCPILPL